MANPTGGFIWYELMTSDADAASAFYSSVVGWRIEASKMEQAGMDYRLIARIDGSGASCGHAGGMLALTDEMIGHGAKPGWLGYICVADVDAAVSAIVEDGGAVHLPPQSVDGIGRFAMIADPQGAVIYLMTPTPSDGSAANDVFTVDQPQSVRWNELVTPNDEAAVKFYGRHFGWQQEGAIPMGDLGDYRFLQHSGTTIGAVMRKADFMPVMGWTFYIGVDDIDRAVTAARHGGARFAGEPMQIPGGEYSVQGFDPQGAYFGLVGPRIG